MKLDAAIRHQALCRYQQRSNGWWPILPQRRRMPGLVSVPSDVIRLVIAAQVPLVLGTTGWQSGAGKSAIASLVYTLTQHR